MPEAFFPRIGEEFVGRYRIESVVGTGGFSQVYRARQTDLGRDVAIKVLKPIVDANKSASEQMAKFEQFAKRFEREAKLISRLKDRNTIAMYDYGRTEDGLLYMVLEFVDGITISELLYEQGALAPERVVKILRQALQSLHEAHSFDVLHRDIKPGNIMVYDHVGRSDLVKVLDFGIAKTVDRGAKDDGRDNSESDVTADGVLVGTPRYMSPEQIRGKHLGPGSDIYSLGLVSYEMLMGMKAVDADSSLRIIARHLDTEPILVPLDSSVPVGLRQVVNTMLLKDPADRYQTCNEVLDALENWDKVEGGDASDPTVTVDASNISVEIAEPAPTSNRNLVVGIVIVTLLIVGMLAVRAMTADSPTPAPAPVVAQPAEPPPEPPVEVAADPVANATRMAVGALNASQSTAEKTAQTTAEFALRDRAQAEAARPTAVKRPSKAPKAEPAEKRPVDEEKPKKKWMFTID